MTFLARSALSRSLRNTAPGSVLLRKFVKAHKNGDLVEEVQLIKPISNIICYDFICYVNGRKSTVSINDLAFCPRTVEAQETKTPLLDPTNTQSNVDMTKPQIITHPVQIHEKVSTEVTETPGSSTDEVNAHKIVFPLAPTYTRRSVCKKRGLPSSRYGAVFSH